MRDVVIPSPPGLSYLALEAIHSLIYRLHLTNYEVELMRKFAQQVNAGRLQTVPSAQETDAIIPAQVFANYSASAPHTIRNNHSL